MVCLYLLIQEMEKCGKYRMHFPMILIIVSILLK